MTRVRSYAPVLFVIIVFSCSSGQQDLNKIAWKNAVADNGISFSISETGRGQVGKLDIQFAGWQIGNKLVQDTLDDIPPLIDSLFLGSITEEKHLAELPKGSTGYIRVNAAEYFGQVFSRLSHYTLYYTGIMDIDDLRRDSAKLIGMNLFDKVEVITADEAIEAYSKNNPDMEWKHFLETNPLPSSIALVLHKELYFNNDLDSIRDILKKYFPQAELTTHYGVKAKEIKNKKKNLYIYRFTVL